jgi:hypothetical protein
MASPVQCRIPARLAFRSRPDSRPLSGACAERRCIAEPTLRTHNAAADTAQFPFSFALYVSTVRVFDIPQFLLSGMLMK